MDTNETTWMTYEEAAKALGIKADSVRRRAAARKWPKRPGNDKLVRVGIPSDIIPDITPEDTPAPTPDVTPDNPDEISRIREDLAAARSEISGLRDRLADAHADRDRIIAERDKAAAERDDKITSLLEQALQPQPGIIQRIFGRSR